MGYWKPSWLTTENVAEFFYDTLDPVFGEGAPLEDVAEQVREGDLVGAGLEAVEEVFIEPIVDYTTEAIIDPIIETGKDVYEKATGAGKEFALDLVPMIAIIGLAYLATR